MISTRNKLRWFLLKKKKNLPLYAAITLWKKLVTFHTSIHHKI